MIMVNRGAGMLAPGFGLLFALFMNVLTFRVINYVRYCLSANLIAFHGPRDHLMYIPLQYWSIVYFVAAIIYGSLGAFASKG